MTFNIGIFVQDNAEPLDFTGPFEVFNNTSKFVDSEQISVFTIGETADPINAQGLSINPTYSINTCPTLQILLVPGGGTTKLMENQQVLSWIEQIAPSTNYLLSVCTGSLIYAKIGLLLGMTVTSHFGSIQYLRENYPDLDVDDSKRYIDNNTVITSAGISAGIDMALHVVEKLWGLDIAYKVTKYMEYNWERTDINVNLDHLKSLVDMT